ncbi:hypothetical protein N7G274_010848 [Stereocaulon virgatum]|uniref:Uncharacterized protein n=1 Tax=Stereocaulon virgatum TaxID=373712 RepID=A0ABR3ZSU8_9LECA
MYKDSIRAWAEEVDYGEPSSTQPPFDKSGNNVPGSWKETVCDLGTTMRPKQRLRKGSVTELSRPERMTSSYCDTEAVNMPLKVNRNAIPARRPSKDVLYRDESLSKRLHAEKPRNGEKESRDLRKATEVSEPSLVFEVGDVDLELVMPGYRDNLRRLDSMYAMSEITKEDTRQRTIDSRKQARLQYTDPEHLAVIKPTDAHGGTSAPRRSRFVENFHLDVTEPRPEKPSARRPRTDSDLYRTNAIRRPTNTYVEHRTKSLRLEKTEPLNLPYARWSSTSSDISRSKAIRRPSNTYVEHNADALKVAVVKIPPVKTNGKPSGKFY